MTLCRDHGSRTRGISFGGRGVYGLGFEVLIQKGKGTEEWNL